MFFIHPDETKAWCLYLAALHTAVNAGPRRTVQLPVSYGCTRRVDALVGCGTCRSCVKQLILRGLHTSNIAQADEDTYANDAATAIFQYLTELDPRFTIAAPGLGDDLVEMDSPQFARVMQWAGTIVPIGTEVFTSSAHQAAMAESATEVLPVRGSVLSPIGPGIDREELAEDAFKVGIHVFNQLNPVDSFEPFAPCPVRYEDPEIQLAFQHGYEDQMNLAVANSEGYRAPALRNGTQSW